MYIVELQIGDIMKTHTYLNKTRLTGEYQVIKLRYVPWNKEKKIQELLNEALKNDYELIGVSGNTFIFWNDFGEEVSEDYVQARRMWKNTNRSQNKYFFPIGKSGY